MVHTAMTVTYTSALIWPWLLLVHPVDSIARMQSNLTGKAAGSVLTETQYTQNGLCRQNNCVNPIFPGLNDLSLLEAKTWQCSTLSSVQQFMDFCHDAVNYDPALENPGSATEVSKAVKAQEDAAMTMFVYHLNGMGYDAWDYRNPSQTDNSCVQSIWKMVCYTYFPRSEAGCQPDTVSSYKRPCKSSCQNYLKHCAVECCDESVKCVVPPSTSLLSQGYVDVEGPSAACTGSSRHSMSSPIFILLGILGLNFATFPGYTSAAGAKSQDNRHPRCSRWILAGLLALALSLQGCNMEIPHHVVGNWRTKVNYLTEYSFIDTSAGSSSNAAVLNSCNQAGIEANKQCSGRGFCKTFTENSEAVQQASLPPLAFCQCERDWADPECGTKRKSQTKAFFLSVFLGYLGADYFYLGFPLWGIGKLCTLGGLGFWWLLDIVRTGAGPVYAYNFRTAHDLPHWVAVLFMIFLCMLTGFVYALQNYLRHRRQKRQEIMQLLNKEEARDWNKNSAKEMQGFEGPRFRFNFKGESDQPEFAGRPEFSGYGAALPVPHHNARAPYASDVPGNFGAAGIPGQGSPTPAGKGFAPLHIPYIGRETKYVGYSH
jgi:hypothetical protein